MDRRQFAREALLLVGDLLIYNLALVAALSARHLGLAHLDYISTHLRAFNILFSAWVLLNYAHGLYDLRGIGNLTGMFRMSMGASIAGLAWAIAFFYFFYPFEMVGMTPKTNLLMVWLFGSGAIFLWRRLYLRTLGSRQFSKRVVILGEDNHVREVSDELVRHPHLGYSPADWGSPGIGLVVVDERWAERNWGKAGAVLGSAAEMRVPMMSMSAFYESLLGKVAAETAASVGWLIGAVYGRYGRTYRAMKRGLDLALSSVMLLFLSPLLGLGMALIWWTEGRPCLYAQERVGRMGRTFRMWKLRTMRVGAERTGAFGAGGDRSAMVTPLGKWLRKYRLDEIPQLWNVLRGEMSLVGPRPEWSAEVVELEKHIPHYSIRHLVRPGVTGWAQLNFRATDNVGDSIEKFRYDLYYIRNMSLDLDLTILVRTVRKVLAGDEYVPANRFRELTLSGRRLEVASGVGSLAKRRKAL
jgi:lipopolysaccharide/colanic/teichoic acid biosynthesis glycosyltransferase